MYINFIPYLGFNNNYFGYLLINFFLKFISNKISLKFRIIKNDL